MAGAMGRMGRAVTAAIDTAPDLSLVARFDRPGGPADDGLVSQEAALEAADVVIDFTTPVSSAALAEACVQRVEAGLASPALVIGSTGLDGAQIRKIDIASDRVAIVRSGNYSLGVNVLMGLVQQAAERLGAEAYDIEVFEAHHRRKVDAPSGTALMLGEAAAAGRGVSLAQVARRGRDGITGERPIGEIGFAVMRGGGIVGEHSVTFAAEDELVVLSHSGRDRGLFARGALAAARWVAAKPPGLYDMADVLGFSKGS